MQHGLPRGQISGDIRGRTAYTNLMSKALSAVHAFVRFVSRMNEHVPPQVALLREASSALPTNVIFRVGSGGGSGDDDGVATADAASSATGALSFSTGAADDCSSSRSEGVG